MYIPSMQKEILKDNCVMGVGQAEYNFPILQDLFEFIRRGHKEPHAVRYLVRITNYKFFEFLKKTGYFFSYLRIFWLVDDTVL